MSYTPEKKKKAIDDIEIMLRCADKAGIRHALFIGFGLLLGIIREGDFIGHDDDVDMCILADKITAEQEADYFRLLGECGMFFARGHWCTRKCPDGHQIDFAAIARKVKRGEEAVLAEEVNPEISPHRLAWFTLRHHGDNNKFCHWLMFPWNGYYWHTKAGRWVTRRKFDPNVIEFDKKTDDAIMKGIPQQHLEELMEIEFYGLKVNIPVNYGACLDFWYPGWVIPMKGGASAKQVLCRVRDWLDERTWTVKLVK